MYDIEGGIVRFDARDVEAVLHQASIHLPEVQRGVSKVGAGGGYNVNVPSTHPSFPASVIVWVVKPSELPGILVSVPDSEREDLIAKKLEQQKRSKTARRKARKAISASSGTATLDNPAFDNDDDEDDGSKECLLNLSSNQSNLVLAQVLCEFHFNPRHVPSGNSIVSVKGRVRQVRQHRRSKNGKKDKEDIKVSKGTRTGLNKLI